jgi:hypothetical protein
LKKSLSFLVFEIFKIEKNSHTKSRKITGRDLEVGRSVLIPTKFSKKSDFWGFQSYIRFVYLVPID